MSRKAIVGGAALMVLIGAAAAFYLFRVREEPSRAASFSQPTAVPASSPDLSPSAPSAAQPSASESSARKSGEPPAEPGLPLRTGETLEFSADVSKLTGVATLKLVTAERRNFMGKNAWHLQAFAHTQNPLRMIFELDDQFDSYSDATTMASLQYEMHLHERGQKVDSIQRMSVTGKDPALPDASITRILPGTRDPLGFMQFLRGIDWTKTPEVHGPVYDGHKLYDVRAKLLGAQEPVSVKAGSFPSSKIEIRVFDNGTELKDASFTLYLANNATHTPVLLEAIMPFANARVELVSNK